MRVGGVHRRTIWAAEGGAVEILDQTLLPFELRMRRLETLEDAAEIMVTELTAHRMRSAFPSDVALIVENDVEREVFEAALRKGIARS